MVQSNGHLNEEIKESLDELKTFPFQVTEYASGAASGMRRVATGQLGQVAERTIRDILGWRPKTRDSKGFTNALDQAFTARDVEGRTMLSYRAKGLAVRGDLGAIVGAQASIYAHGSSSVRESIALAEKLVPLRADADHEDIEAVRSIAIDLLAQLEAALGAEGGPIVQHVDQLLELLIDYQPAGIVPPAFVDPADVGAVLGELRRRFGLESGRANTIEEERVQSDFGTLVELVSSLMLSWHAQRTSFFRGKANVFFGTQLIQLDRALEVVVESVHEAECAMDLAYLGPEERQATQLELDQGGAKLTIAELLDWISRLSGEEAQRTIKDSGKDGVQLDLTPKLRKLSELVSSASKISDRDPEKSTLPAGFHSARVRFALKQLKAHLATTTDLASAITRAPEPPIIQPPPRDPVISTVLPFSGRQGERRKVHISGKHIELNAVASLERGSYSITGEPDTTSGGSGTITVIFDLQSAQIGDWDVVVENPSGRRARWDGRFHVLPPDQQAPHIKVDSVHPPEAAAGSARVEIEIKGHGFDADAKASFERLDKPTLHGKATQVTNDGQVLHCWLDLSAAQPGERIVYVTNPNGPPARWHKYFNIYASAERKPEITNVEATKTTVGSVELDIAARHVRSEPEKISVTLRRQGKRGAGVEGKATIQPDGTIHVSFNDARLVAGDWELHITNKGLGSAMWETGLVHIAPGSGEPPKPDVAETPGSAKQAEQTSQAGPTDDRPAAQG